jgi:predicted nucleic acid-binding protein
MNIVDSSAWLEYFASGVNMAYFADAIENTGELLVPTISLYEVFKRIVQQRTESEALQVIAVMQQGRVIDLDTRIALIAARISIDLKLPFADSVILSTARSYGATLWTQDAHFEGLENVRYKETVSKQK